MLYFVSGIFPLMFLGKLAGEYARVSIQNANLIYGSFMTYIPIVVSCAVMWYLHKPEKAFALHAQPYSRGKLFNTHIITGWLMIVIPVILTGLIYLAFSGSLHVQGEHGLEQAYTAVTALKWIANSISIYTYCYGLCTLAGSLVGNTVTQVLGSLVFYNIVPAFVGTEMLYSFICLDGYTEPSTTFMNILFNSDPMASGLIALISGETDDIGLGVNMIPKVWYLLLGLIFILIAKYAVYKGKLEKVGDSMIFPAVENIVTGVITFIGGALLGAMFGLIAEDKAFMILGAILGACLSFFLVKLILERSARIFSKRNIRVFIIALVLLLIFILIFVLDITGYAGRVPEDTKISSVETGSLFGMMDGTAYDDGQEYINKTVKAEDGELIAKVTALHRYVTENKLYDFDTNDDTLRVCDLSFNYTLKNGGAFRRDFRIALDDESKKLINDILNDKVVRDSMKIPDSFRDVIKYAEIDMDTVYPDGTFKNSHAEISGADGKKDILRMIDAYNADREKETLNYELISEIQIPEDITIEEMEEESVPEGNPTETVYNYYIRIYYDSDKKPAYEGYVPFINIDPSENSHELQAISGELVEKYLVTENTETDY